jgi:hypothetical protein
LAARRGGRWAAASAAVGCDICCGGLHRLRWWPSAGAVGRKRRSSGREEEKEGNEREGGRGRGSRGAGPCGCGANPAGLRSEARFELLSSAWLRGLFRVRWALPSSCEPGYQTARSEKRWDEVRFSESTQATKHTLNVSHKHKIQAVQMKIS